MFSQSTPIPILTTIVLNNKFKNIDLYLMGSKKDRQNCKVDQTAFGNILINKIYLAFNKNIPFILNKIIPF